MGEFVCLPEDIKLKIKNHLKISGDVVRDNVIILNLGLNKLILKS